MRELMTGAGACPDENSLVRFSTGQLSGPDLGALERHIDTCSSCRSLIAQLASGGANLKETGDGALAALRQEVPIRHGHIGRYQIERLLGGGGMGMVYAARDKELNRVVAIKLLRTSALANLELRSRLLREAQTMAKLSHPNLVPIFELGSDQGDDFLAMELIDGPTLHLWLRERKREWRDVVRIFIEAGRGLEAAHQAGVVHRDFKPSNVLVGSDGRARVTDFGLSRPMVSALSTGAEVGSIELTREGSLLGTPAYMAPEQLEGQVADVRSDQFGFCVALAEALVGHRPFVGRTLEELRSAMRMGKPPQFELEPARLKRVLLKGMSISADQRFDSIGSLLEELTLVLKPSRANARAVALGMGLAVVLAAGAGLAWQQMNRPVPAPAAALAGHKTVSLSVGEQTALAVPGLQSIGSVDANIVGATMIGDQQVSLTGLAGGKTTLVMQTRAGSNGPLQEVTWDLIVEDTGPQYIRFPVGKEDFLTIPGVTRVAVGNPELLKVGKMEGSKVSLSGLKAGTTTLLAWRGPDSPMLQWSVTVSDTRKQVKLVTGAQQVLTIPGIERVAIGDSAIADVKTIGNNQLLLIGAGEGTTTLLVWTHATPPADQERLEWDVVVAAPEEDAVARKAMNLLLGTQKVLTIPGIQRVAVGDSSIADVKTIGNNQLLVIAAGAGTTTLIIWTSDTASAKGRRLEWDVTVGPGEPAPAQEPGRQALSVAVGAQKVLTIPGIQRVAIGDSSIADVKTIGNNQLLLIGAERGTTTLLVWKTDGARLEWNIKVTAPPK